MLKITFYPLMSDYICKVNTLYIYILYIAQANPFNFLLFNVEVFFKVFKMILVKVNLGKLI